MIWIAIKQNFNLLREKNSNLRVLDQLAKLHFNSILLMGKNNKWVDNYKLIKSFFKKL